ncbi:hypothetical protein AB5I41_26570 [Sphingomonas sp. MMS24-JH45]
MPHNRYYDGPPSDHFDGTRFFNPGQRSTDRGLGDMLRWKLGGKAARWPSEVDVEPAQPRRASANCASPWSATPRC